MKEYLCIEQNLPPHLQANGIIGHLSLQKSHLFFSQFSLAYSLFDFFQKIQILFF